MAQAWPACTCAVDSCKGKMWAGAECCVLKKGPVLMQGLVSKDISQKDLEGKALSLHQLLLLML